MSEEGFKVKAIDKGYYDAIREPGIVNRAGEPLDVFYIKKKSDFSPVWMEAIGWDPGQKIDDVFINEDGTKKSAEQVANMKSDKLDEKIRQARASKIVTDEKELAGAVAAVPEKTKRSL